MHRFALHAAAAPVLAFGFAFLSGAGGPARQARDASAVLRAADGAVVGSAEFTARGADSTLVHVVVDADIGGAEHGVHVHAVGRCDPPGFTSAGGHLNPFGRHHGLLNPEGAHAGDLPNMFLAPARGGAPPHGELSAVLAVPLDSILDADGSAIVVHAGADDQMSDPSGNSGARVACGVVTADAGRRRTP